MDTAPPKTNTGADIPRATGATPAMAQWFSAKADHPDALLFFRMGDFYELFFADAEAAAAALDIALSHRGEHNGTPIPMCGVPHHASEVYLNRLIRRGFRVAIVEQMEDPKARTTKAPIKRAVVRIVTPGTITEEALLEAGRPNLLLALAWDKFSPGADLGAAWVDVSTGVFETAGLPHAQLQALLGRLEPAEILAPAALDLGDHATRRSTEPVPSPPLIARRRLAEAYQTVSLDAFGTFSDGEAVAAAMALDYIRSTQAGTLPRLSRPEPQGQAGVLAMDAATRASLEIHRGRDGGTVHTLLASVQRTLTAAGARLLGGWLALATDRCRGDPGSAGCLVVVPGEPGSGDEAADRAARRTGHGPRFGAAVAEPGDAARSGGYSRRAARRGLGCRCVGGFAAVGAGCGPR